MSNSIPAPRSKRRTASPLPLPLTPGEAETLRAAVQRIIRGSDAAGQKSPPPGKKKSSH